MARGVNKVMLMGNVGKDPEFRSTPGGTQVASFSFATADRGKDTQGNWVDKPEWHNIVCFDKLADLTKNYIKKGSMLFIDGKITTRSWDDKESGQKKYRTEIIANDITFVSTNKGAEGGSSVGASSNSSSYSRATPAAAPSYDQRQPASAPDYGDNGITDDDIPF